MYEDYLMNCRGVDSVIGASTLKCSADVSGEELEKKLKHLLRIRFRQNAPQRAPKIFIIGPPGSGRTTQAKKVADLFGLVHINPQDLLREEAKRIPAIKIKIAEAEEKGQKLPDDILLRLIDSRMQQSDCRMNGWVIDGFPETDEQVNLLKSVMIRPNLVCIFEQKFDTCTTRLCNRRIDPTTGQCFNVLTNPPPKAKEATVILQRCDKEEFVSKRY